MNWLYEDSLPAILVGLALLSVALIAYLQTRRAFTLALMIVAILIGVAGVVVEQLIETNREQVASAIYDLASAAENNDAAGVLRYVSSNRLRAEAHRYLNIATMDRVRVMGNLEIEANNEKATAKFQGFVSGKMKSEGHKFGGRFDFTVQFEKHGKQWVVVDYQRKVRR